MARKNPTTELSISDIHDLERRALAAYFRHPDCPDPDQPSAAGVNVREVNGLLYVTVANSYRLLACYRVRHDDKLKRLKRVPAELDTEHA